jgi:hypothetical protein
MGDKWPIRRRTFLKGLGTAMALPWLEAMAPVRAVAKTAAGSSPLRMAFVYVPNGVNMSDWTPKAEGSDFELPFILEPLQPHKGDIQVLSGLAHRTANANGDGPGDHARASASFLTGVQARKTAAMDIRAGVSVDQVAAGKIGNLTRFPSLELSCDKGQQAGACDSGYACAYQFNLAWKSPSMPLPPEVDPRLVFERLFASADPNDTRENRARRQQTHQSILDFVLEDARQLQRKVGATDRIYDLRSRDRAAHRAGGEVRERKAGLSEAGRHPGRLRAARPLDVRHHGAGVPDRFNARGHVHHRARWQQPQLSGDRRAGRPS